MLFFGANGEGLIEEVPMLETQSSVGVHHKKAKSVDANTRNKRPNSAMRTTKAAL